jgi:hypothetical protein
MREEGHVPRIRSVMFRRRAEGAETPKVRSDAGVIGCLEGLTGDATATELEFATGISRCCFES